MSHKVLYIGGFDLPDKNAAAQRVISNSKLLKLCGCEVRLIGLDKNPDIEDWFIYQGFYCKNIKYPYTKKEWIDYLLSYKQFLKIIEDYSPTIIIAYNYPAIALRNLHRYCKKRKIKLIADCTEWYSVSGNVIFKIIKGFDVWYRMRVVHKNIDGLIVISKYLQEYYSNVDNLIKLPPLVDKSESKWQKESTNNDSTIKFVYAGSPDNKDRLDKIVSAMRVIINKYNKKWNLTIIGIDKEKYISLYNNKEIPDFIEIKGRMPHLETIGILKRSDFQIFIRDNNITTMAGFPTKFVETVSAGILVLTNKTSDIEDYLEDGRNGFFLCADSLGDLEKSFSKILDITKDELNTIKAKMDTDIFDYKNYKPEMIQFLKKLDNYHE